MEFRRSAIILCLQQKLEDVTPLFLLAQNFVCVFQTKKHLTVYNLRSAERVKRTIFCSFATLTRWSITTHFATRFFTLKRSQCLKKQNVIAYHIARCNLLGKGNKAAASKASMNYARKWHEAGSKRVESRVKNGTNQAQKWHKLGSNEGQPGSKMAQTGLENGTNQA